MLVLSSATTFFSLPASRVIADISVQSCRNTTVSITIDIILTEFLTIHFGCYLEHTSRNVMFRLARESIFTDRSSIPHWPFFFTSSADCPPMTRPTFSHPSFLFPQPCRQLFRNERTHPHSHTDNRSLDADRLPPKHHCRKLPATDRIILIAGFQLACLTTHHTGRIRVPALPTGCLSIPPHSACSSCLSPATSQTLCQWPPAL